MEEKDLRKKVTFSVCVCTRMCMCVFRGQLVGVLSSTV